MAWVILGKRKQHRPGLPGRCLRLSMLNVRGSRGYTLIEMIVVLLLLTIAATVVAPSFILPRHDASSLRDIVQSGRATAVRRGELVRLHIAGSGEWQLIAGATVLSSGRLSDTRGSADLLFSPLGSCGSVPEDPMPEALASLDPLTCEPPVH
jgi:prepilin-type N-terminal cleavage/methylation domain-containing protein